MLVKTNPPSVKAGYGPVYVAFINMYNVIEHGDE